MTCGYYMNPSCLTGISGVKLSVVVITGYFLFIAKLYKNSGFPSAYE
jgi:hypothetical protein